MQKQNDIPYFSRIEELYQSLSLRVDHIEARSGFDIHDLAQIITEVPFQSPVFKVNFFSFIFVKDAVGVYVTDEQQFHLLPGTVYFTNPGHYRSFEYTKLEAVCLITLSEGFLKEYVHADIFGEFPFLLAETVPARLVSPDVFLEFEAICQQIQYEYRASSPFRCQLIGVLLMVLLLKFKRHFWLDYNAINEGSRSSEI